MKKLLSLFILAGLIFLSSCNEMDHNPPAKPELLSPTNLTSDSERNLTFNWKASKDALSYTFQLSLTTEFTATEVTVSDIDALSHTISNLKWSTHYFWRVNAKNSEGTSPWSDVWEFTTKSVGIPQLIAPINALEILPHNQKLEWSSITDATGYNLEVSLESGFSSIVFNEVNLTNPNFTLTNLDWNKKYYWRVNASSGSTNSDWSDVWEFITKPVGIPQLIAPTNALNILQQEQKLEWSAITDATGYNLEVSLESGFSSIVVNEANLTNLNFTLTNLDWNKKYYWRVNASVGPTNSDWSEVWNFTTNLPIPTDNLIAYYPFNGNANDETGNGNNGTVNGAILTADRFGSPNDAFYFDGNDAISVASNETLNLVGDMAISIWFYSEGPPEFRTNHTLISKIARDAPGGTSVPYDFNINYQVGIPTDYKKPMFVTAKNGGIQYLQSANDIINNAWNHAVVMVSGSNIKIYINNTLYLDTTIDNSIRAGNAADLLIGSGNRTDPPAEFMVGKIDDIRIYKRALTSLEILALYLE